MIFRKIVFISLVILLVTAILLNLSYGAIHLSLKDIFLIFASQLGLEAEVNDLYKALLLEIRLPRIVLAILIGSSLAVSGAAMQGLFRNPLADPSLLGISSGAMLAAVITIVLGWQFLGHYTLPIAAFIGSLSTTFLIYLLAYHKNGQLVITTLLLAGIAINAFSGALVGLLTYIADDNQLRTITFWNMGSLAQATWVEVLVILPFILSFLFIIIAYSNALNALLLGEKEAYYIGFPVEFIKGLLLILVALAVGTGVAITGTIGFIGLVVPHIVRLFLSPDYRILLPASMLLGACLLLFADLISKVVVAPAELPIGIITVSLGGPFFLYLLWRQNIRLG